MRGINNDLSWVGILPRESRDAPRCVRLIDSRWPFGSTLPHPGGLDRAANAVPAEQAQVGFSQTVRAAGGGKTDELVGVDHGAIGDAGQVGNDVHNLLDGEGAADVVLHEGREVIAVAHHDRWDPVQPCEDLWPVKQLVDCDDGPFGLPGAVKSRIRIGQNADAAEPPRWLAGDRQGPSLLLVNLQSKDDFKEVDAGVVE